MEAETLAEVYGRTAPDAPAFYVGSAKANLGYLETASGAAGLIKAALALNHRAAGLHDPGSGRALGPADAAGAAKNAAALA
ncbi:hypothetical protein [Streptomyces asiaticus]